MKCPLNADTHMKKTFSIGFVALLLLSMATVAVADPWDTVVDNPTPAQAVWVDPKNTTGLDIGDEFVVDVICNITDPNPLASPPDGIFGFEYKLKWNSTILNVASIQYHTPSEWTMPFEVANSTSDESGDGHADLHWLGVATLAGTSFAGVTSVCTYNFTVLWQPVEPAPDFCGLLDLYETEFTDDTATIIISDTIPTGTTVDGTYCVPSMVNPPIIDVPSRTPPGDIEPDQAVKVSVNVTDAESGVKNVTLSFTITNGTLWTDLEMVHNATSGFYEATIPGQTADTWVKYLIIAYDNAENSAVENNAGEYYVYVVIPEFPSALILPLFMVVALVAVILGKTALSRKRSNPSVAK